MLTSRRKEGRKEGKGKEEERRKLDISPNGNK
jgi:hypothetical protein